MMMEVSNGLREANYLRDERRCNGAVAPILIGQTGHIDSITADKGYDQIDVKKLYRFISSNVGRS